MTRFVNTLAGAAIALIGLAGTALAVPAFTATGVNLRAGPGADYPAVSYIPPGVPAEVFGCLGGWSWCDVGVQGQRGWVPGGRLDVDDGPRRGLLPEYAPLIGLPLVTFDFGTYWGRYYRDRPWFATADRWGPGYRGPGYGGPIVGRPGYGRPPYGGPGYRGPGDRGPGDRGPGDRGPGDRGPGRDGGEPGRGGPGITPHPIIHPTGGDGGHGGSRPGGAAGGGHDHPGSGAGGGQDHHGGGSGAGAAGGHDGGHGGGRGDGHGGDDHPGH